MNVRFGLLLLACAVSSATVKTNRGLPRRHVRRTVREYLAPPALNAVYATYGPPAPPRPISYRPGRFLSPPTTEAPGYFSRLASWLNPFGGSPATPSVPETSFPPKQLQSHSRPSINYGPPPPPHDGYPPVYPQPPPAGPQGYLPPQGKNCNPCNKIPWIPLHGGGGYVKDTYPSFSETSVEVQSSIGQESKNYLELQSQEVRLPDFTFAPPPIPANLQPPPHLHLSKHPVAGPIPNPHLYPGAMPPLFKAKPFNPPSSPSVSSLPENDHVGYVDVLPPGAEIGSSGPENLLPPSSIGEIVDSPPSGYSNDPHRQEAINYEQPDPNIQQSHTIHEEHSQLGSSPSGYTTESESVGVAQSGLSIGSSTSIEYPIHYEQSPVIDVTAQAENQGQKSQNPEVTYAIGLNPPPNEPAGSYVTSSLEDTPRNPSYSGPSSSSVDTSVGSSKGAVLNNSYGLPVGADPPRDSQVAPTVNNVTVFESTVSFTSPSSPITNDEIKVTSGQNFPTAAENVAITNKEPDTVQSLDSLVPSINAARLNEELLDHHDSKTNGELHGQPFRPHQELVDSYQRQVELHENTRDQENLQQSTPDDPQTFVPYRPSSVYVPFPPYPAPSLNADHTSAAFTQPLSSTTSGPTTDEPFLEALMKSYDNFKQEMAIKDYQERLRLENEKITWGTTTWTSQPEPSSSFSQQTNPVPGYTSNKIMPPPPLSTQYPATKRNKQVQIIIPYTSQHAPSPFQPSFNDWSGRGTLEQTQARKVPIVETAYNNYASQESRKVEVTHVPKHIENLLIRETTKTPTAKTNNSIDVLRLQKNIDNWTIQEYSRRTTSSTALPSSSHPYLLPSKKIPEEYLTTTQSVASEETLNSQTHILPGFNFNDLEHEGSASSRVEVPHIQVVRIETATKPAVSTPKDKLSRSSIDSTTTLKTTTTEASWQNLPVSISPHNNERVYVVTPQPVFKASKVSDDVNRERKSSDIKKATEDLKKDSKSSKFDLIERAYQVLPQAVNNLALASTGPENTPLWGIMEHEEYAKKNSSTLTEPILYSGHSKVSNTRQ